MSSLAAPVDPAASGMGSPGLRHRWHALKRLLHNPNGVVDGYSIAHRGRESSPRVSG